MKFVDMFCGMGTIRMGFEQAGHECVYSVEWDKHKREIYKVIFGDEPNASDIRTITGSDIPISDCWCFGAPCQDFSIAGIRAGLDGDRSSLVREVFRLVRETPEEHRPEWLLYENVKGMFSSNKGLDYLEILFEMASLGYDIQYELLNSKDFGVPQNRERVYTLGHLRARGRRKVFPIGIPDKRADISVYGYTKESSTQDRTRILNTYGVSQCLRSTDYKDPVKIVEPQVKQIGNVMPTATRDNPNQGRVYDTTGLAPCLNKMEGGGREPLIVREATKKGYTEAYEGDSINLSMPNSKTRRGRVGKGIANTLDCACNQAVLTKQDIYGVAIYDLYNHREKTDGICETLTSNGNTSTTHCGTFGVSSGTRIRRLTPRECMRLQGVPDYITDKLIEAGISDTQMYRAAGDACTVNVIYEIARRLREGSDKNGTMEVYP